MRQDRTYSMSQPHTYTSEEDMLQDTWVVDGGSFACLRHHINICGGAGRGEALV